MKNKVMLESGLKDLKYRKIMLRKRIGDKRNHLSKDNDLWGKEFHSISSMTNEQPIQDFKQIARQK
jgi:hypothetical protein